MKNKKVIGSILGVSIGIILLILTYLTIDLGAIILIFPYFMILIMIITPFMLQKSYLLFPILLGIYGFLIGCVADWLINKKKNTKIIFTIIFIIVGLLVNCIILAINMG